MSKKQEEILQFIVDTAKGLLQEDNITDNDDFFLRGGDSLMAIDLISIIQQQYNVKLELIILFENPILSKLANVVLQRVPLFQSAESLLIE